MASQSKPSPADLKIKTRFIQPLKKPIKPIQTNKTSANCQRLMFAENNQIGGLLMSVSRIPDKVMVAALKLKTVGNFLRHHSKSLVYFYMLFC